MGILLVYDVTDEASFNNIRNWMRNIEQHASDNVNKVPLKQHVMTYPFFLWKPKSMRKVLSKGCSSIAMQQMC